MISPLFLTEAQVEELLDWDALISAIELAMSDVSARDSSSATTVIQPARGIMPIPHRKGVLLTMPGLSERDKVLSCKLVTSFSANAEKYNLPSIMATIAVFNTDTGKLQAIVEATTITEWRTAAATIVATRHLKPTLNAEHSLAVVGAGRQARTHILAFHDVYKFKTIRLWNRTFKNAQKLALELETNHNIKVHVVESVSSATAEADVIVTATYTPEPLVHLKDIKKGVLINAIGAGIVHHSELHPDVYNKSAIYTDSLESAKVELKGLIQQGFHLCGEVGDVINKTMEVEDSHVVVFHSLGMAVEDAVAAKLVLNKYNEKNNAA